MTRAAAIARHRETAIRPIGPSPKIATVFPDTFAFVTVYTALPRGSCIVAELPAGVRELDDPVAERTEDGLRGGVVRFDECAKHFDAASPQGALAGPHEPACQSAPLIGWMDREPIDPTLAAVVRPEDRPHEPIPVDCAEVEAAVGSELPGDRGPRISPSNLRIQAASPEEGDHLVVVVQAQRTDPEGHRQSREMRCRVGSAKSASASEGRRSRRKDGIKANVRSSESGSRRIRMWDSRLGTYPCASGVGNSEFRSTRK